VNVDLNELRQRRIDDPESILRLAAERRGRAPGSKLMLVAADHPARGAIAARGRPDAMADRGDLLERLVVALGRPGVDGVLGTPDILEDLLLLGALEDKVVVGSMNRGGLAGSNFEFDDRYTAFDAETIAAMGFDGGKMLVRIALDDPATARTLEHTAGAVSALARHGLMAMVEPFMSEWRDGKATNLLTAEQVVRSAGIAAGLGTTSRHTWLKLPVVAEMERVAASTTLPILLLGGDPKGRDDEIYEQWRAGLALPGVRGLVVGRALLYPDDDDVGAAVDVAAGLVGDS
jgi:DhnA family fructose-bisphosphate aldolase class Ia